MTLQRSVAATMILTFVVVMIFVAQTFVPPLTVAGALFAIPLAAMPWRARGSAIAIGALSAVWVLFQLANLSRVAPDLARPEATMSFVVTIALLVVPLAGVVGLVGVLRRASGRVAAGTLQAGAALLGIAVLAGVAAGTVAASSPTAAQNPVVATESPARVTLADNAFQPAELSVDAGTEVTWSWQDGSVEHNVVADDFQSETKSDGTFTRRMTEPGTYAYRCTLHPGMTGTITVTS